MLRVFLPSMMGSNFEVGNGAHTMFVTLSEPESHGLSFGLEPVGIKLRRSLNNGSRS